MFKILSRLKLSLFVSVSACEDDYSICYLVYTETGAAMLCMFAFALYTMHFMYSLSHQRGGCTNFIYIVVISPLLFVFFFFCVCLSLFCFSCSQFCCWCPHNMKLLSFESRYALLSLSFALVVAVLWYCCCVRLVVFSR